MDELKNRLVRTIERRGMTQAQVAAELRVSPAAVSAWCKGVKQPSMENLAALAGLLEVDLDYLVRGQGAGAEVSLEVDRAKYLDEVRWYFRPEPPDGGRDYGDAAGFAFREGLRVLARECGQNTGDAKLATEPTATLEFTAIEVSGDDLTRFLAAICWDDLRPRLEAAAEHVDRAQAAHAIGPGLAAVSEGRLVLLRVSDYGTTGLLGDEYGKSKFVAVMRNTLDSDKGERAGGSYGLGKATMWASSRFGLVISSTNLAEPYEGRRLRRIIGRAELPWHSIEEQGFAGPGWLGLWDDERKCTGSVWENAALEHDLFLDRPESATGTSFLIVAAYDTSGEATTIEQFAQELERGAATSFWPAMVAAEGDGPRLRVRVRALRNREVVLDREVDPVQHVPARVAMFARHLSADYSESLADEGSVVARQVNLTVPAREVDPDRHASKVHDALLIVARSDDLDDSDEQVNTVEFMRGSRMIIRSSSVRGLPLGAVGFRALVLAGEAAADDDDSVKAERFLRASEPPEHNNWIVTRKVTDAYPRGARASLDDFLKRVASEIRELVKPQADTRSDGPDALRELLRLKPPMVQREKKPRVKTASGELQPDGAWKVSATISLPRLDDGKTWVFQPVVKFASSSGAPVGVKWRDLRALQRCSEEDGTIRADAGVTTVKVEGETDPSTHPLAGGFAALQLDVRNYRSVA